MNEQIAYWSFCFLASFLLFYFGLDSIGIGFQLLCLYVLALPYVFTETTQTAEVTQLKYIPPMKLCDPNKVGLYEKYEIKKKNGDSIDPSARYFVLRYDNSDEAYQSVLHFCKLTNNEELENNVTSTRQIASYKHDNKTEISEKEIE